MMQSKIKIIALALVLMLTQPAGIALAQSGAEDRNVEVEGGLAPRDLSASEIECADKKPDLKTPQRDFIRSKKGIRDYRAAVEKLRESYHQYISCLFGFAEDQIMGSVGISQGTVQANTQNLEESTENIPILGGLVDWMTPSAACIDQEKLREVIEKTHPDNMLPGILETYNEYRAALENMNSLYDSLGGVSGANSISLDQKRSLLNSFQMTAQAEMENALVAIDISFAALKELRLAFTIHIGLQCLLNNLDKYRAVLSEIRNIIEILPGALQDASMAKG